MSVSEHAGQLADAADLVDVDALIGAYFDERPDPSVDGAARRLRHLRAPRDLHGADLQRGPRARDRRGDLPLSRGAGHRRPALPGARHARALRARGAEHRGGALRPRRRGDGRRRRRLHADAGRLARDPHPQSRGRPRHRRRHRRHPVAQPAPGRRREVQPAPRRAGRHRRHRLDAARGQRAARERPARRQAHEGPRHASHRHDYVIGLRRRPARRHRPRGRSATAGCASASTRSAARASPTGRRSPSATAWT